MLTTRHAPRFGPKVSISNNVSLIDNGSCPCGVSPFIEHTQNDDLRAVYLQKTLIAFAPTTYTCSVFSNKITSAQCWQHPQQLHYTNSKQCQICWDDSINTSAKHNSNGRSNYCDQCFCIMPSCQKCCVVSLYPFVCWSKTHCPAGRLYCSVVATLQASIEQSRRIATS